MLQKLTLTQRNKHQKERQREGKTFRKKEVRLATFKMRSQRDFDLQSVEN
jgi:hypothetical protein